MARKPHICDCGSPFSPKQDADHRIKCAKCVKATKSRDVKKKCVDYLGGKCVDCGFEGHAVAFDFDHDDPSNKSFKISGCYMFLWRYLKKELDKCSLRCCRCHRLKHYLAEFGHE
jgi:hypothetical protein